MTRLASVFGAVLAISGTALAQDKPLDPARGGFERTGDTVTFQLNNSIVFVEGTVNGEGPFTFIFDTGASVTVLRPRTAEKLGLVKKKAEGEGEPEKPRGGKLESLMGLGARLATVDSLGVGKAVVRKLPVAVMAVPQADLPLGLLGIKYDGIVGYNFISQFVTTIDYKARTIKFVPNDYTPEDPATLLGALRAPRKPEPPAAAGSGTATLGFSYRTLPDDVANEVGLEGGVEVRAIASGSPAEKGGLRKGDIIREVNGKRVDTADQYRKLLASLRPGDAVKFSLIRDRKDVEVQVTSAERP